MTSYSRHQTALVWAAYSAGFLAGHVPNIREIMARTGLCSVVVHRARQRLQALGYLAVDPGKSRAVSVKVPLLLASKGRP